jgi:hypothetical protein
LGNNVAVWPDLSTTMAPVAENPPLAESYNSALGSLFWLLGVSLPPATSTLLLGSNVAVWPVLASAMAPVGVNPPLAGSYSSASESWWALPFPVSPPAMSTCPSGNKVAVDTVVVTPPALSCIMLPVALKAPLVGSYSSALEERLRHAPTKSTFPFCNNVAVW